MLYAKAEIKLFDFGFTSVVFQLYFSRAGTITHKYPSGRWFRNGIHSLLKRADARGPLTSFTYAMHIATL